MASHDDVRFICSRLRGAVEGEGRFGFGLMVKGKHKGFCWTWLEKVHPKKAREENPGVLAIRTPGMEAKAALLAAGEEAFFDEPHYAGNPAILVRLDLVSLDLLEDLLVEGWRAAGGKP